MNKERAQTEVREDWDCHSHRDSPKTRDFRFPEYRNSSKMSEMFCDFLPQEGKRDSFHRLTSIEVDLAVLKTNRNTGLTMISIIHNGNECQPPVLTYGPGELGQVVGLENESLEFPESPDLVRNGL